MIGDIVSGRYELIEKIGEGGSAIVYKAKDVRLNRYVALKILKDELSKDKDFVEKFKREALAVATFSNNNIVNIYDVGSEENLNYIVLEYVKGKTLKEVIKENSRLDWTDAINYGKQIALALDCAHKNNIIHRDIKPHNILVTEDGVIKVTDFGIAKGSNSVTITSTDKIMGSAHYLSPEQARGTNVDCKTDIYSLGIVLYEMVTGRVPYDGDTPVTVALKHIQEDPIPPIYIYPNIPGGLNSIILKAIEKDAANRYENVKLLYMDLDFVLKNPNVSVVDDSNTNDNTVLMDNLGNTTVIGNLKDEIAKREKTPPNKVNEEADLEEEADYFDEDSEYDDEDYEENKKPKVIGKKRVKRNLIIGAIIIILIVGVAASAYVIGIGGFSALMQSSPSKVTVPSIVGLTIDDAKNQLTNSGLVYKDGGTVSNNKPAGQVVSCNPSPGTSVNSGATVTVVVSSGPKTGTVPDVSDQALDAAKNTLTLSGFTVGNVTQANSDTIPNGYVISTDPNAGSSLQANGTVNIVVSSGPKTTPLPDITNKTLNDAKNILQQNGFTLGNQTNDFSPTVPSGSIISTDPPPGTQLKANSAVNVVISQGPKPVQVTIPTSLKGSQLTDAENALTGLGLKYTVNYTNTTNPTDNNVVFDSNPEGGTAVNPGTNVALSVYTLVVPDVTGKTPDVAKTILSQSGYTLGNTTNAYSSTVPQGAIISENPTAGTQASPNSSVSIVVSNGPDPNGTNQAGK